MYYRRNSNALQSTVIYLQRESKKTPCGFLPFFPKWMGIFNHFYTLITPYAR